MSKKEIKFEDALKRLDQIVEKLETGDDDLDSIVKYYKEGNELIKLCSAKLDNIENKIEEITKETKSDSTKNK